MSIKLIVLILMAYPIYRGVKGTVELIQYWLHADDEYEKGKHSVHRIKY